MSRGPAFVQRINDDVADQILYVNNTLNVTPTGAVSTAVLRFNAAGTLFGPFGVNELLTANEGLVLSLTEPGVYSVELTVSQTGAVTNVWGIGFNQVSPIVAVTFAAGAVKVAQLDTNALETASIVITTLARVSQTQARAGAGGPLAGFLVRGLAQATGGGAPTGAVAATVAFRINKIWDVAF